MKTIKALLVVILLVTVVQACATTTGYDNRRGRATQYEPISEPSRVQGGVGIEANDIVAMTDRMMRDVLASPAFGGSPRDVPPRVVVDARYFVNESSSPIDKKLITDRLRIELNRAADGRLVFVARHRADMVEHERRLQAEGVVDEGAEGTVSALPSGADYRLAGRIGSLDKLNPRTGAHSRYTQISFELIQLDTGIIAWSGIYEFQKVGEDDIVYQ